MCAIGSGTWLCIQALRWDGRRLSLLDQTLLPGAETWLALTGAADTAEAIARLAVRGAPNIGIAAAYGLAMELSARPSLGALEEGVGGVAGLAADGGEPGLGGRAGARRRR